MKTLLLLLACCLTAATAHGQEQRVPRFSWAATVGTGISLGTPASTPFLFEAAGYYNIGRRISADIGTGVAVYEKTLIPLMADFRLLLTRPRKFTPFLQCGAGYAFALSRDANGGFCLNPAIGVQYALREGMRLQFSAGYGQQRLERLKSMCSEWFGAQFSERLTHRFITLKAGVLF